MSKYSYQFKLKILKEYLNGTLGYRLLAKKYNIPSKSVIQTSVNQYQINEKEAFQAQNDQPNKDEELERLTLDIFKKSKETYGYRRIKKVLKKKGLMVNHKRVLRLMNKLGIQCTKFSRKTRRYSSYKGTVGKIAKNRVNRRFTTPFPLQKLVTDVTEFKSLNDEKLYLSPIMSLYNLEIISFKTSKIPTLYIAFDICL